ncbi:cdc42 effector protein 1 [Austrofundulus limnaeus]|uniref:Cdc42 effector protein 1-like n=1 Tax=Austrofundulus limnaeus TaxID=52670 RepID=A0A2I4CUZ4_AUSLI|nr:PREDICTED: cdc42 effector protein 1-like [Austrofundulus limnaeus]XP_013883817.1 PREDICTED: cdc42 effector protein 1-like [Austrofundulus limnaeus]
MNLQEKLSGLKGLVSHSHSKRRHKSDLTVDMISPPLGDFRHTMHVGRGGDVFGDTSFLSNHGGTSAGSNGETDLVSSPDNKIGAFFSRTLRQIRRGSDNRPREGSKELSPPPPAISPIIKNAISLPRLDMDMSNGSPTTKMLFASSQNTPEERKSSYGVESGFVTLPRLSRSERQQPSNSTPMPANIHRGSLTDPSDALLSTCSTSTVTSKPTSSTAYSDSLPSLASLDAFTFDLGPSLFSEVFSLIDGHSDECVPKSESEQEPQSEGSEMGSATLSYVDSLLMEDCRGGKSPRAADFKEDETVMKVNRVEFSGKVPDVLIGSPDRAGVRMESERFRSATDVLACHYGISFLQIQNGMESGEPELVASSQPKKKQPYSFMDDEDEIKV